MWRQPKAVWAVAFASVVAFMGIGLVDPILKPIADNLGASPSQVSLLFTSYMAVMGVAMLVTGVVSSRIGPKRTLLLGLAIIIVGAGLAGMSSTVTGIVGWRALWGLGNALFIATALATIVNSAKGSVAQAVILYEAALGLGIAVGPLVGGVGDATDRRVGQRVPRGSRLHDDRPGLHEHRAGQRRLAYRQPVHQHLGSGRLHADHQRPHPRPRSGQHLTQIVPLLRRLGRHALWRFAQGVGEVLGRIPVLAQVQLAPSQVRSHLPVLLDGPRLLVRVARLGPLEPLRRGLAFGSLKVERPGGFSETNTSAGWTIGAGAEFAINQNWSAKVEYLYVDLSEKSYVLTGMSNGYAFSTVRLGVNYRF